ncbi:hypothetical protein BDY17DRAFT_319842 [Neohortaea acidophila]|uniref:MIT domain-containing protein n=1 Tax=Neohortaea acidophila TaxID=245834 RepID=A0A6A6Q5G5_9PEZI|nr:uncharacterized protein BDY17DRAFT_319842 [Neohortaea acidophila]KAF2487289.1 hypothetical protein BDY17DRAFT_319842 [Neohortaea acidophila]
MDGAADSDTTRTDTPLRPYDASRDNPESWSEPHGNGIVKDESRPKTSRPRGRGEREKKDMLSKALHKANTAVVLDNAQNFEGALEAYSDACTLLRLVMNRSTGADDKRKLDAIRSTYIARIEELHQMQMDMGDGAEEKELPPRPESEDDVFGIAAPAGPPLESTMQVGTGLDAVVAADPVQQAYKEHHADLDTHTGHAYTNGLAVEPALNPTHYTGESLDQPSIGQRDLTMDRAVSADAPAAVPLPLKTTNLHLPPPQSDYTPVPLSPKRGQSPTRGNVFDDEATLPPNLDASSDQSAWLDTIREDRSSRGSSVHSVSSQQGLHRKHLRTASGISNPDFDAAFDAAVEAAYDEGLEPDLESVRPRDTDNKVQHAYHGSSQVRSSEIVEITSPITYAPRLGDPILGADEEEERILDDIARDYGAAFIFDRSTKSALPRQSDSSGYSRSTWQSSQVSDRTTAGTSLSTVTEDVSSVPPLHNAFTTSASINSMLAAPPPPLTAPPPQMSLPTPPTGNPKRASGVRNRRLSGQNPKQLKIETPSLPDVRKRASTIHQESTSFKPHDVSPPELDQNFKFGGLLGPVAFEDRQRGDAPRLAAPADLGSPISEGERPGTATTPDYWQSLESDDLRLHYPPLVKKNKSEMSLREHRVLLSSPTFDTGPSLVTPLSSTFMNFGPKRNIDTPLTSQRATLPSAAGTAAEGKYADILLFDTTLSDAQAGRPLSNRSTSIPAGVEPCPESFLLRPFWLMRNIHASLTHPKGAFLTSKLFVPREVWQTRGVKLKSIEDKIAQLDLLTAALGKLGEVDTLDAEAVMVELQSFEDVMERVQAALSKRLGGDVGVGGLPGLFREASYGNLSASSSAKTSLISDAISVAKGREGGGAGGKGYLASWRKLRSKSSGAPVAGMGSSNMHNNAKGGFPTASEKEAFDLPSVPMTSWYAVEHRRGAQKREQARDNNNNNSSSFVSNEGPQREYVNSLVRLFDGVRILDQIARQVEDPGLRAQSTTHVSMELSVRHAAEFFAFYVCRFVLADVGVLLDKFIKRGTEWVQA